MAEAKVAPGAEVNKVNFLEALECVVHRFTENFKTCMRRADVWSDQDRCHTIEYIRGSMKLAPIVDKIQEAYKVRVVDEKLEELERTLFINII